MTPTNKPVINIEIKYDRRAIVIRKLRECIERNAGAVWAGSVKVKLLQDALELLEQ